MSRAELAEAVDARIWAVYRKRVCPDADTVGRYERGVIRWPSARHPTYASSTDALRSAGVDLLEPNEVNREDGGVLGFDWEALAGHLRSADF